MRLDLCAQDRNDIQQHQIMGYLTAKDATTLHASGTLMQRYIYLHLEVLA
jgi:hypothetical protein